MKKLITAVILLKIGFILGVIGTLYFTKSKLMIDIGVVKDTEDYDGDE